MAPFFLIPTLLLAYLSATTLRNNHVSDVNDWILQELMQPQVLEAYNNRLMSLVQTRDNQSSSLLTVVNKILVSQSTQIDHDFQSFAVKFGFSIDPSNIQCKPNYGRHRVRYQRKSCFINSSSRSDGSTKAKYHHNVVDLNPLALGKKNMMVLLNSIQYRSNWIYPFDVKYHKWIKFWVDNYRYKLVTGMHFETVFPTVTLCGLTIVALPYPVIGKNRLALMIVIPNTVTGLKKELDRLKARQNEILNVAFQWKAVNVNVPVFSVLNDQTKELVTDMEQVLNVL